MQTNMNKPILSISQTFDGNRLSYMDYRRAVISIAASATTLQPHGVLGVLLSTTEFDAIYPRSDTGVSQFIAFPFPGTWTSWLATHPANELDGPTISFQRDIYTELRDDHRTFEAACNSISCAIITSLKPDVISTIGHVTRGTATLDLGQLFAALDTHYGHATPADITATISTLELLFKDDSNMVTHLATHRRAHQLFEAALSPLPQAQKVLYLFHTFRHQPKFLDGISNWMQRHPILINQIFESLSDALPTIQGTITLIHSLTPPIETTSNYSSKASSTISKKKKPTESKKDPKIRPTLPDTYCWSHGLQKIPLF